MLNLMVDVFVFVAHHTVPWAVAGWDAGFYWIDRKHLSENLRGWSLNRLEK